MTWEPPVDVAQTEWEFDSLLWILDHGERLDSILEVGIWEGGTLWHWLERANHVVGVDDAMRDPGPEEWHRWAEDKGTSLTLFQGSSHGQAIVAAVERNSPYDMVFIDADHSYSSVKADWENYSRMVCPGGIVALHDITPRPGYGVNQFWNEIKSARGSRTLEIVENSGKFNGIGVVFL